MMRARALLSSAAVALTAAAALGDGMVVPVRPELRVRGSWAVKYHHVSITVREQVASVSIDQEFVNTGREAIEVEYLFPVPPGAAIDSMTLVANGKEYAARLLKADEARKVYEDIVRRKKDPALLEYAGFGLYKSRAFPLEPGKPCKTIVTYKGVCRKDRDVVEVWYPLSTEKFSAKPIESVRVRMDIKSKADIGPVYSPTHSLKVDRLEPRHVVATYEACETLPTSDIQVFYRAANEAIGVTLLTYQRDPGKDGHFMLLASPSPRADATSVVAKDVVCVFDHSGSMSDDGKIGQAKAALRFILGNLNPEDRFDVVSYNDAVETFFGSLVPAARDKITVALDMVDRLEATGGTDIHAALQAAMKTLAAQEKPKSAAAARPGYVIFLTDGAPTFGVTDEKDILEHTRKANTAGARLFTFGVGYEPNVRLLDRLAAENSGRSEYVRPKEPIEPKVSSLYRKIKNPMMTDVSIALEGVRLKDMYPRELGDLFEGDQIVAFGRYDCRDAANLPTAAGGARRTTLVIKGLYKDSRRTFEHNVTFPANGKDMRYAFVEKIWAVRRVGYLLDEIQLHGRSKEVIDELIRLSKTYGIMTPYTSFLADERTHLARPSDVRAKAAGLAADLAEAASGEEAQRAAVARKEMAMEDKAVPAGVPANGGKGAPDSVVMYGNTAREAYEQEKVEYVAGIRTVGNVSLYRRGRAWVAAELTDMDMKTGAARIKTITRYSKEYFDLVRHNTVSENQVMASQQADEELVVELRGQIYHIK
jgi:Ca-activated chloride channel family protein